MTDGTNIYVYDNQGNLVHGPSTSSSTEINWALSNLTSGRTYKEKVVVIGNYELDDTIKVPSYTILEIQGKLTLANNINKSMIENDDQVNGNTDIEIVGGELNGNKTNQTSGHGINFVYVTNPSIKGVCIHDVKEDGIRITGNNDVRKPVMIGNIIHDCDGIGIDVRNCYYGILVKANHIQNCGSYGILIFYCRYAFEVIGNICYLNDDDGIRLSGSAEGILAGNGICFNNRGLYIGGSAHNTIYGNVIFGNNLGGIYTNTDSDGLVITDNYFAGNNLGSPANSYDHINILGDDCVITGNGLYDTTGRLRHGIYIEANDCVVSGNIIDCNGSGDGVRLVDSINTVISDNRITNNGGYGVNETGTSDYTLLDGNNLRGNTTGSHTVDAANSIVGDNIT